ncbi:Predicted arabinose efflux permease, MFS family [Paenibacillus sophorae]|uniref:MFS transporter n=1 Tax=Paenibacillus sophorae TaxID=1333845 RepID=A0A1H8KDT7_9BACL|nr:MFS transporter [Paenibacillus sophorae]QWU13696.1 MFS transporter [Paenibacillus sophorae]SEN90578.1 Predicted arabinose efflux permease, MFS family [Paenibacillus sophorae]
MNKSHLAYTATLLTVTGITVVSLLYVMIPLTPYVISEFSVTPIQAVWASSIFSMAFALGNLFFGTLSDRVPKKRLILAGLILLAGCTLSVEMAASFTPFLLLRALQGFLAASFPPVALAYVSDVIPPAQRPNVISYLSCGFLLAGVIGQIFSAEVAANWGMKAVFALLSFLYVILIVLSFWLPKDRPNAERPVSGAGVFEVFRTLVRIPALLVTYGAAITILMSFVAMFVGLNEFAVQHLHLTPDRILWLRLISMLGMMCALFSGSWIRRFGPVRVLVGGFLTAAAGLAGEAALLNVHMAMFSAATVIFVAGIAAAVPSIISRIGMLGSAGRGMALALYGFFVFVGASLGPILAAALMPFGFAALCGTLSVIMLAAAAVMAWSAKQSTDDQRLDAVNS